MKSKQITSTQKDIHPNLAKTIKRYQESTYQRPIEAQAEQEFLTVVSKLENFRGLILDSCCGVGESSYHIAIENPDRLVLGVDKSAHRLARNNAFKKNLPINLIYLKGNIIDYWSLAYKYRNSFKLEQVNLFFPNPYPKADQFKKRWQGHPIVDTLFKLGCTIELRTNWKVYQLEFEFVAQLYKRTIEVSQSYLPERIITPFERKYLESAHELYVTRITE